MSEPRDLPEWLTRIEGEYREMPGLQLTEPQMRRFWGLDGTTSAVIIEALLSSGLLVETPKHAFVLSVSHVSRL